MIMKRSLISTIIGGLILTVFGVGNNADTAFGFDRCSVAAPVVARSKENIASPSIEARRGLAGLVGPTRHVTYARFSPDGKTLESLAGQLASPVKTTDRRVVALKFMRDNATLFGLSDTFSGSDLRLSESRSLENSAHFIFQPMAAGLPVFDARIDVHVGRSGVVELVGNTFPGLVDAAGSFTISEADAQAVALRRVGVTKADSDINCDSGIFVTEKRHGVPARRVCFACQTPPGDWEVTVDGSNGTILELRNRAMFLDTASFSGQVYLHHPLSSPLTIEPLADLNTGNLGSGTSCSVENQGHMGAWPTKGVFLFDPSNTHFDEVNAYFHISRMHDWYATMGFDRPQIGVLVHAGYDLDNAYYTSYANAIYIGDGGDRFYPLAREESVMYHEYAHAVVDKIVPLRGNEGDAMNEGQADYFACSFSGEPRIGEYVASKMNRPYLRTVENKTHYPEDIKHEPHDDGQIWSATLWDLRNKIGASVSDLIIFKSYFVMKAEPNFVDGLLAMLQVDKDNFGGVYHNAIVEVFQNRGITFSGPNAFSGSEIEAMVQFDRLHESIPISDK
ncbi:MAG: M36 family metallopeptidase [Candidatus Riflebacteria bacterium]|nr:M36 family metallopeptidase [Candidatus Riflebacteria bacterium]